MEMLRLSNMFWIAVLTLYTSHGTATCSRNRLLEKYSSAHSEPTLYATCEVSPNDALDPELAKTNDVTGRILIRHKLGANIEIRVNAQGLDPDGPLLHGFHVHENGDVSGGCDSTGSHYNPYNLNHGGPDDRVRHVGDLGNVERDAYGNINTEITDNLVTLWGVTSIYGRAFMIHAEEDDLGDGGNEDSLTTGNAGARLACCVIGHASEEIWD